MPDADAHHRDDHGCLSPEQVEMVAAGATVGDAELAHMEHCAPCRARIEAASANIDFVSEYARSADQHRTPATAQAFSSSSAGTVDRDLDVSPDLVPGYRIVAPIHAGGQGVVYKAVDEQTQRTVAIKMLLTGRFATPEQVRRFEREAEISASLDHPNVVTIYHMLRVRGDRYAIVMEHIEGVPLDQWRPPLPESRNLTAARRRLSSLVRLFVGVCEGVHHAHGRGSLHQDLKPSNILVRGEGERAIAKVVDFGMARPLRSDATAITQQGHFGGTIRYASPERLRATSDSSIIADVRSDVYSLGVILFELLSGRWPFEHAGSIVAELEAIESSQPLRPSTFNHAIDRDLETIILTAMHKETRRRYDSAGALGRDLARWLAGEAVEARRDSGLYQLRKTARRYRVPLGIAAVLLVGALVLLFQSLKLKNTELKAANAKLLAGLNNARAESTSRDSDVMEAQLRAASRNDPGAERMLWRVILDTFAADQSPDPVTEANRERIRREALWALRGVYARDPCLATTRLPLQPRAAAVVPGALIVLAEDGSTHQVRLPEMESRRLSATEADKVRALLMEPGARLGTRLMHNSGRVWVSDPTGKRERDLIGHTAPVRFASEFTTAEPAHNGSASPRHLVSFDQAGIVKVWRLGAQPWGQVATTSVSPVRAIWLDTDRTAVSVNAEGAWSEWTIDRGGATASSSSPATVPPGTLAADIMTIERNSNRLALGDRAGTLRVLESKSSNELWRAELGESPLSALAWSSDGRVLGAIGASGRLWLWRADGSPITPAATRVSTTVRTPSALGLDRTGQRVLIGSADGWLSIGRIDSAWRPEFQIGDASIVALDTTNDGEFHVVVLPSTIALMDARCDGRELLRLPAPNAGPLTCAASSPDGRFILAGNARGEIIAWDLGLHDACILGNLEHQLEAHAPTTTARSQLDTQAITNWLKASTASAE